VIKNSVYGIYFARCMNIFNSLLAQLVKYDVHTTRKINSILAIFYHILSFSSNAIALLADYITVVENRPIMSVKSCLPVSVFHFRPKLM